MGIFSHVGLLFAVRYLYVDTNSIYTCTCMHLCLLRTTLFTFAHLTLLIIYLLTKG